MRSPHRAAGRGTHRRRLRRRRRALPAVVLLAAGLAVAYLLSAGTGYSGRGAANPAVGTRANGPPTRAAPSLPPAPPERPADELRGRQVRHLAVPILMYHVIAPVRPGVAFPELYVSGATFAAQMKALAHDGYHGVTLQRVWDAWHQGAPLPRRPVVVSFDDGYMSQYSRALPVLHSLGWPGVLNLKLDALKDKGNLRPTHIRRLMAAGWEIDPHTITHPDLTTVDSAQLRREVAGSRTALMRQFGVPANFFCYPSGRYDDRVVAAVRAAGYRAATTVQPGLAAPAKPFTLARLRVVNSDSGATVGREIAQLEH